MNGFFIGAAITAAVCVLWWTVRSEKGARCFVLSALQGIAAMFAVNLTGIVTGVTLATNWYTVATYIVLGLPGVIATLVINLIL